MSHWERSFTTKDHFILITNKIKCYTEFRKFPTSVHSFTFFLFISNCNRNVIMYFWCLMDISRVLVKCQKKFLLVFDINMNSFTIFSPIYLWPFKRAIFTLSSIQILILHKMVLLKTKLNTNRTYHAVFEPNVSN